ncbi:MAG TPA: hypothetical protein VK666_13375 [Chryseolinea sp.]|nr:hypothetical protein [Chryseolinea sp.]
MKPLFFAWVALFCISSCSDEITTPTDDVNTFSKQIEGKWILSAVSITPKSKNTAITIAPINNYACNQISSTFQAKDVVSQLTITLESNMIKVFKEYTCSLPPEQLSWLVEPDNSIDDNINWMTGKNFTLKEINEGTVAAQYTMLFFNLDHCDLEGKKATADRTNQLWLEVAFDEKENSDDFVLKFNKVM